MSCCGSSYGIPLIEIIQPPKVICVPHPCEFSCTVLREVHKLLDVGQTVFSPGDRRRFGYSLKRLGILGYDDVQIERPDLWYSAMYRSVLFPGTDFQQTYLDLLSKHHVVF